MNEPYFKADEDFFFGDEIGLREHKEKMAEMDSRLDNIDRTIKQLPPLMGMSEFFNEFTVTGEVQEKPRISAADFDAQEMRKRDLQQLNKKLVKAERKLERLTGKTVNQPKPEWVEQDDTINMVVRKVFFGFYAAWVTSIGDEAKRGVRFYARNPYHAYLMARRWACRGASGYFLSTNIRFEGM